MPVSIGPIIKARQDAVSMSDLLDVPTLGFEAWLSSVANALVVGQSKDAYAACHGSSRSD